MADNDTTSEQMLLGQKLFEKLTMAGKEDIADDNSCYICDEDYFTGPHRETPMKAPCGHIFGGNCIQVWISSVDEPEGCPMCKSRVLDGRILEEQSAWDRYDELSEYTVRQPLSGDVLAGDAEQWALKAESLWQQFCEVSVHSLEDIHYATDWMYAEGYVARQLVRLATVDRFASEREKGNLDAAFNSWYSPGFGESYNRLCAHLDAIDGHDGTFLTPGEDHHIWLAHQHRKIREHYEQLLERVKPRDVETEPEVAGREKLPRVVEKALCWNNLLFGLT